MTYDEWINITDEKVIEYRPCKITKTKVPNGYEVEIKFLSFVTRTIRIHSEALTKINGKDCIIIRKGYVISPNKTIINL